MSDTVYGLEKIERGYMVRLSTGDQVRIDPCELEKVLRGIQEGGLILVKQGVINPSYVACIIEDVQRQVEFYEANQYRPERLAAGFEPLKDIFEKLPWVAALKADNTVPRLEDRPRLNPIKTLN